MRLEELQKVKGLISTSTLLTPMEKADWLKLLPNMNDKQVADLMTILAPKTAAPAPAPMPPVKRTAQPMADYHQKEIPEHLAPAPQITPKDLQKKVESIAEQFAKPVTTKPIPAPRQSLEIPPDTFASKPYIQPDVLHALKTNQNPDAQQKPSAMLHDLKTADDFKSLSPAMLHSGDAQGFFKKIFDSLMSMTPRQKIFPMLQALEQSALYQTYVNFGLAMLNDPNKDRDAAYDSALRTAKAKGDDFLSRPEFEAMADFRSQVDQYLA